ncbi:MAG: molybdopterin molybdenumtransferase MoeA, partial [Burkholderiaceae bacterium]
MSKSFIAQTIEMALEAISSTLHPIAREEFLGINECGGRVLAQSVIAPKDIPEAPLSAMDGYAFHSGRLDKLSGHSPLTLKVLGKSLAGHGLEGLAGQESCIRIFTGAVVPREHDTVIPQELVAANDAGDEITFSRDAVRPLANVRTRGEDLAKGSVALTKGTRMGAREIALLASMGIAPAPVSSGAVPT